MLLTEKSILIVEDEFLVGELLEDMVRDLGCDRILRVSNVPDAFRIIEAAEFDAAIIDMNLDGSSGKPVGEALASKGIRFVISTGYDPEAFGKEWGQVPILQKPFQAAQLDAVMKSVVRG